MSHFFRIMVSPPKDKLQEAVSRICSFCARNFGQDDVYLTVHNIPEPYKWNTSFDINNKQLNKQHSKLFDKIDDMCNNPNDLERWVKLVRHIKNYDKTHHADIIPKDLTIATKPEK